MEWINEISNMDNVIYNICIKNNCLTINIKLWNGKYKKIEFVDYYGFKEKNSIGQEIGDIIVQTNSAMLDELKQDILNGQGSLAEMENVKSFVFYNSWNEVIIMEILAKDVLYS